MKNKTYMILFFISLAFNIAFLGNFAYHRYFLYPHHKKIGDYESCRGTYGNRMLGIRERIRQQRRMFLSQRREFMRMLREPDVDEKTLKQKLQETLDTEMKMERKIGEDLIKLRMQMDNKEARRFFGRNFNRIQKNKRRIRQ